MFDTPDFRRYFFDYELIAVKERRRHGHSIDYRTLPYERYKQNADNYRERDMFRPIQYFLDHRPCVVFFFLVVIAVPG
jgi:hypothetical protein